MTQTKVQKREAGEDLHLVPVLLGDEVSGSFGTSQNETDWEYDLLGTESQYDFFPRGTESDRGWGLNKGHLPRRGPDWWKGPQQTLVRHSRFRYFAFCLDRGPGVLGMTPGEVEEETPPPLCWKRPPVGD